MLLPNETILKAISWTLLHSLWQGLILAIFAGLVILFTKKAKANLRYSILAGLFLAFMMGVGFTFNYEYQSDAMFLASEEILVIEDFNQDNEMLLPASETPDYFQLGINYLNQNSTAIVLIWFLIFSIKCFGIFKSLSNVYRIRNYRNQAPPEYWSERVLELSQLLKIKKHIVLLESQLVTVPSVTGFFKPIILIPIGLLSNLPQDQIEAILLHELAHIRRKDYFINLIQSFAEILFFFNPGVLWVSSIIKEERENCCDDIAVGITQSKSKFINALVSFQEYNMKQNKLAMGFGSKKNQLLERAKRIIYDNNKTLNSIEKTFLSICIIIIASFTVACSNTKVATAKSNDAFSYSEDVAFENDTIQTELSEEEQAMVDAEVAEAEAIADIEVRAEDAQAIAEVAQLEAEEAQRQAEIAQEEAEKAMLNTRLSAKELAQIKNDAEQAKKDGELARIEIDNARKEGERAREESIKAKIEAQKARIEAQKGRELSREARLESQRARLESQKAKIASDLRKVEANIEKEKYKKGVASSVMTKETITDVDGVQKKSKMVVYADVLPALKMDDISKDIIGDLIAEKVIASVENLSYKLSNYEFIVNDKNLSEKTRLKFKKYLSPNIAAVYYNFDVDTDDAKNKSK